MNRDGVEVPRVLEKCCEAIELHGLDSMGIYRISGTTSRVQRLKAKLDRGTSPPPSDFQSSMRIRWYRVGTDERQMWKAWIY